jgi:hypothetical protein
VRIFIAFLESDYRDLAEKPLGRDALPRKPNFQSLAELGTGGGTELLPALRASSILSALTVKTSGWYARIHACAWAPRTARTLDRLKTPAPGGSCIPRMNFRPIPPARAKFFDDTRGSAIECAACLDASVAERLVSYQRVCPGKEMLGRLVAMLTRLGAERSR